MKQTNTSSTASETYSAVVGGNDLKDILSASVSLVEPTQEKDKRLLLTVNGTSWHEGSISKLSFDGRMKEKGVSFYQVTLASVYIGGTTQETSFNSSLLLPAETEESKVKVTEVRVQGTVVATEPVTPTSRSVVKPVPLPHPR
jgi:hypothetical protein